MRGNRCASWQETLQHAIDLDPEYITLYRMRYKGTRIAAQAEQVTLDQIHAMQTLAKEMLSAAGYEANPGKNTYSKLAGDPGTSDYLTERVINGTPYLGLGLGAQTLSHHTLSYNAGAAGKNLTLYQQKIEAGRLPLQDLYHLSREAAMGKMISVSFYFGEINRAAFERKFGLSIEAAFPNEVAFVIERGLMEYTDTTPALNAARCARVQRRHRAVLCARRARAPAQTRARRTHPSRCAAGVRQRPTGFRWKPGMGKCGNPNTRRCGTRPHWRSSLITRYSSYDLRVTSDECKSCVNHVRLRQHPLRRTLQCPLPVLHRPADRSAPEREQPERVSAAQP